MLTMKKGRSLLRVLRAQQEPKVTQSQIARRAGMSAARYWQIENGEGSEPKPQERTAVAAALGVRVSDIDWPDMSAARTA